MRSKKTDEPYLCGSFLSNELGMSILASSSDVFIANTAYATGYKAGLLRAANLLQGRFVTRGCPKEPPGHECIPPWEEIIEEAKGLERGVE